MLLISADVPESRLPADGQRVLFLGDSKSALIVVMTIPLALLSSAVLLFLTGQTINIITLGGLALAVGILVDEATVTVENVLPDPCVSVLQSLPA